MTKREYKLSDFYLYLKLGIWYTGVVESWGLVQKIDVTSDGITNKGCFVTTQEKYKLGEITGTELLTGLNLLGLYPLNIQQTDKSHNKYKIYQYWVVLSECRLKGTYEENIYYLKVTNHQPFEQFRKRINNKTADVKQSRRKIKDPKLMKNRFRNNPIYSVTRKY